jgi:hypothetical protein
LEQVPGHFEPSDYPVIGEGAYTARRVEVDGRGEGFRLSDCGGVTFEDSYVSIRGASPGTAACDEVHSDGLQGYHATGTNVIRNVTLIFETECGTSPFYIGYGPGGAGSGQPPINTGTYEIRHVLVGGSSGYPLSLQVASAATDVKIIDGPGSTARSSTGAQ